MKELKNKLIDWYWDHGSRRAGRFSLSRGGWLDRALRIVEERQSVETAQQQYSKPTMALWGPSQSGKSTFLARFIDAAIDEGYGSALSWDDSMPARFSGDNQGGTVAVLNPYNQGADASGCVTRFQLKEEVEYPNYPVEIQFAVEREILLSLAVGYLSETTHVDKNGNKRSLQPESLREMAKEVTKGINKATPDKAAYALLTEVLDVVDLLIDMDSPRYYNLKQEWTDRRSNLLDNDALVSSVDVVVRFAAELLWDSWENLTNLYIKLRDRRKKFSDKKIFCSIEMAALMLNISSASYYKESDYVRALVDSCTMVDLGNSTYALATGSGHRLFYDEIDFALTQGLVSLIVVPLRSDVIRYNNEDVYNLLAKADIVDFPGVANEHKSADPLTEDMLALDYRNEEGKAPMLALTQVMKRGKTASIVISSARNLNIDVFSLLMRMPAGPTYPANPTQLMNGIRYWFKTMGKSYSPLAKDGELQVNLILTFAASLLNLVNASGTGPSGLIGVFDKLNGMGDLANPDVVKPYCVNYPMFPDGHIQIDTDERKAEVIDAILNDRHFNRLFKDTAESLREMADLQEGQFGGRIYLFRRMLSQLAASRRPILLEQKKQNLKSEWNACMAEALPGSTNNSRSRDIELLEESISKNKLNLTDEQIARDILDFEDISPEVLEVPPRSIQAPVIGDYVKRQFIAWQESAKRKPLQRGVGFENVEHRARVLSYLMEGLKTVEIERWLRSVVRGLSPEERREFRRLIATYIVKLLFPSEPCHRHADESVQLLENISQEFENYSRENNIYYISVVKPFLSRLAAIKTAKAAEERGVQPGDSELQVISTNENF